MKNEALDLILAQWQAFAPGLNEGPLIGLALLVMAATAVAEGIHRIGAWPRVFGYAITGLVFGAVGWAEVSSTLPLPHTTRLIFDLALGVLLFELGGRVHLAWFRRNPWLLGQMLLTSAAMALAVHQAMMALGLSGHTALALALLGMVGSPAVLLRVVGEGQSQGQVTERAITQTALGTLIAVIGTRLLTGRLLHVQNPDSFGAVSATLYLLAGSILLAALLALASSRVARYMQAGHENSVLMQLAVLLLAVFAARALGLSPLLVPLLAGLLIRQLTPRPWAWPQQFGSAAGVLVVLMFVLTTAAWDASLLAVGLLPALVLLLSRWAAGSIAQAALARPSAATWRQGLAVGTCLLPMCGTALVLASDLAAALPGSALPDLVPVVVVAAAIAELAGSVAAWTALRLSGELSAGRR
ncbi:MAG: hypothetical protein RLY71_1454 [Pseudomonadota bacterium]|jgi:Kef-type K+ transport system membrane component KefB